MLPRFNALQVQTISDAIEQQGYIVLPSFLSEHSVQALVSRITSFKKEAFKKAAIGRGFLQQQNSAVRSDEIHWLEQENQTDHDFLMLMENLRQQINQQLFLGLFDYECHYAVYEPGNFYKKHLDALKGQSNRVLSTVLYLNDDWSAADGGELILYAEDGITKLQTVLPAKGTLVIFLSEQFPHEVLAAKKIRYSIAGWFRVNASDSRKVDTLE